MRPGNEPNIYVSESYDILKDYSVYQTRQHRDGGFRSMSMSAGLSFLGAQVCFSETAEQAYVHGIQFFTNEVLLNTFGFLSSSGYDLELAVFFNIVLNGTGPLETDRIGWEPLDPKYPEVSGGFTKEEQQDIVIKFREYVGYSGNKKDFIHTLNETIRRLEYENDETFSILLEKYAKHYPNSATLPPEVLLYVIEQHLKIT